VSKSADVTEQLLSAAVDSENMTSASSLGQRHSDDASLLSEWTDVSDERQVDASQGDVETVCRDEGLPSSTGSVDILKTESDVDVGDLRSNQSADNDWCEEHVGEEHVSLPNGNVQCCVDTDDSDADKQQMSDIAEHSVLSADAADDTSSISTSVGNHPIIATSSVVSQQDDSKLDYSLISSSLRNISQKDDQGLVHVVYSKANTSHVLVQK